MNLKDETHQKSFSADQFQNVEEAITKLTDIMTQMNDANYNFLSIVFHDLRNPLTYIKMSLDVLLIGSFGEIPAEQKELLAKANNQVDRLNKMIDDVLLNAKLENNKLPFSFTEISLFHIIEEAVKLNQPLIEKKGLQIEKSQTTDVSHLNVDYKHFSIAINYLINYCIKSTEHGKISITCALDETGQNVCIDIKDTSACIGRENIPDIFTVFKCFGMMARNKEERTGLELSICKLVIKKHNGTITYNTDETYGNQFLIKLSL